MAESSSRSSTLSALNAEFRVQALRSVMLHSAVAARLGIAVTDFNCLNVLSMDGPQTAGQLAERTGLTRGGAVTAMIDRLETAGFVRRRRDETDRRRVVVELVEEAAAQIAPLFAELGTSLNEYLDGFSTDELELLLGAVREVNECVAAATKALRNVREQTQSGSDTP